METKMNFIKNNILTLCCLTLILAMGVCGDAWADAASLMNQAQTKTRNVFDSVKTITFILGGFGLVGIAYSAIVGKINWKWFAGLAVGLAILAAAGSIVEYATGSTEAGLTTTFGNI